MDFSLVFLPGVMYEHQTRMVACTVCYLCGCSAKFIGLHFPRKKTIISGSKHSFSVAYSIVGGLSDVIVMCD
jgi:hypothetical protein